MKKNYFNSLVSTVIVLLFASVNAQAQCPTPAFSMPASVCRGENINLTNTSQNATEYNWDFTPGFFRTSGTIASDFNSGTAPFAKDIAVGVQNDTIVVFAPSVSTDKIKRIIYPEGSATVTPIVEDIDFPGMLYNPSDVALFQENNEWYGLIVDQGNYSLTRFHLGANLLNAPDNITQLFTVANSNMVTPWSIDIETDSAGDVFAMATNFTLGTYTIYSFGNSITNQPTASAPVSIQGLTYVLDGIIEKECGNFYAFFAGYTSGLIVKADFGNSLTNTPSFTSIITSGSPSDIAMVRDSSHWKLLYSNWDTHDVRKYDLGTSLSSVLPVSLGTEAFGGTNLKGIAIVRDSSSQLVFLNNLSSGTIQIISYTNPVGVSMVSSTDFEPVFSFTSAGTFPVTLTASDAYGNSSSLTQTIIVNNAPLSNFGVTNLCFGDTTYFSDSTTIIGGSINNWDWDFGDGQTSTDPSPVHFYSAVGSYTVTLLTTSGICNNSISKTINISPMPSAAFSTVSGCSNIATPFTDASSIASGSITGWNWNFGTGDADSIQNPAYFFPTGGNYMVSLTVTSDAGCSDSNSQNILIESSPIADFIATNTCIGQSVQFTNQTQSNGTIVSNYLWDFGDGIVSNMSDPSHPYNAVVANYTVQLISISINGCADTISHEIKINNIPTAQFTAPAMQCQGTAVQFTDASIVAGDTISGWFWDFGDSQFDSSMSPQHIYQTPGVYTVNLTAYSPSSCPSTPLPMMITIRESPLADFTFSNTCLGTMTTLNSVSTPASGTSISTYHWQLTPTDSSAFQTAFFTFGVAGITPVTLFVTASDGCSDSITKDIPVWSNPVSDFSFTLGCTNQNVQFTNLSNCDSSSTIQSYEWAFGDFSHPGTNTSGLTNPAHAYTNSTNYNVSLITTTDKGCSDTTFKSVQVYDSAPIQFTYSPTCFGSLMEFFNPGSSLDSAYLWNFGDNQTNQLKEPAHYYANPGNYTVTLRVTTNAGCISSASRIVNVSPIPVPEFLTTGGCSGALYDFQNQSTVNTGSIISYQWNIAEDTIQLSGISPSYVFSDTGIYHVSLTVTSDIGCTKSITHNIPIHGLPTANFSMDPQFGNPPLDVQVTDASQGATSYSWNFGEDSLYTSLHEPSYLYEDTGLFMITQIVTSQYGCKDTATKNIYVIKPILDIAVVNDSSYSDGEFYHIVATIQNRGTREINSVQMEARLNDGQIIREQLTTPIPSGPQGIQIYRFNAAFRISSGTNVSYYCIKATLPNGEADDIPANNEKCYSRTGQLEMMNPYPNPADNSCSIRIIVPFKNHLSISVFDQLGKEVQDVQDGIVSSGLNDFAIETGSLRAGVYTVRIIFNETVYRHQIIVDHIRK